MFRNFVTGVIALLTLSNLPAAPASGTEVIQDSTATLSVLGDRPNWSELEKYQNSITHDEFVQRLEQVYCPHGYDAELIKVDADLARILKKSDTQDYFFLQFAKNDATRVSVKHWWRPISQLPNATEGKPLAGLHIALDPGHLGGRWAKMEERWFRIGKAKPVQEGDMTLRVAQILAKQLNSLGATVTLLRNAPTPLTPCRPLDFNETARLLLVRQGMASPKEHFDGPTDPEKEQTIAWQRELLFYRNSEIRSRADLVNDHVQPDVVLCLHFNAEPWGDPDHPELVSKDHLHLLVNGGYLPEEVRLDDERFEMLKKMLSGTYEEELALSETIATTMATRTGLPPYQYTTNNAKAVGKSGYVYARNLMATRLYRCPTVYLEPYVMNSHEVFARLRAGDYAGRKSLEGKNRQSIYHEYADSVMQGLETYLREVATVPPPSTDEVNAPSVGQTTN